MHRITQWCSYSNAQYMRQQKEWELQIGLQLQKYVLQN